MNVPLWVKALAVVLVFGALLLAIPMAVAGALLADGVTAERTTTQTASIQPGATLRVEVASVALTIVGGAAGEVRVDERDTVRALTRRLAGNALSHLTFSLQPALDGLKLSSSSDSFNSIGGFQHRQLTIRAPSDVNLVVDSAAGDLAVSGLRGNLALSTESGSVKVSDVDVTGTGSVHVVSGDIVFRGAIDGGQVDLGTVSGSIHTYLPQGTNLHYQASTLSGGIGIGYRQPSRFGPGPNRSASGDLGTGGPGTLTMSAISGSISLQVG